MPELDINVALPIVLAIITFVIGHYSGYYLLAKTKIHQVRGLFDMLDDAMADDKVTEDEFKGLYNAASAIAKR